MGIKLTYLLSVYLTSFQLAIGMECQNEIWFQASDTIFIDHYASDIVASAADCARRCLSSFPFCKSAIYEPLAYPSAVSKGYCKYSPWRLNCVPHVPLVTAYGDQSKTILHCMHCLSPAPVVRDEPEDVANIVTLAPRPSDQPVSRSVIVVPAQTREADGEVHLNGGGIKANNRIVFTVMTFNTWNSGNNVYGGLSKIARHIEQFNPDIVGLQEMYDDKIDLLLYYLNNRYSKCAQKFGSNYVITRWPIVDEFIPSANVVNVGCKIELSMTPQVSVNVWNVHLHWGTYGPYAACANSPHTASSEILFNSEYKADDPSTSRVHNMISILNHQPFNTQLKQTNRTPLILMGDFNSPSHLDWTENAKRLHCDWNFIWPVSKLAYNYGLKDSFREVFPDSGYIPGATWSPVMKYGDNNTLEPQDRIDFIYYASEQLRPIDSSTFSGSTGENGQYLNHYFNDWPSDHSAVITTFELDVQKTNDISFSSPVQRYRQKHL